MTASVPPPLTYLPPGKKQTIFNIPPFGPDLLSPSLNSPSPPKIPHSIPPPLFIPLLSLHSYKKKTLYLFRFTIINLFHYCKTCWDWIIFNAVNSLSFRPATLENYRKNLNIFSIFFYKIVLSFLAPLCGNIEHFLKKAIRMFSLS